MAEKFAIYAGEPVASVLAGYERERSARINQVCEDWRTMIEASIPALELSQWCAVIDVTNGSDIDDDLTLRHLWAGVEESPEICELWGVDREATAARLRSFSRVQMIALREVIRRYWFAMEDGAHSHEDALRQAGAVLQTEPPPQS